APAALFEAVIGAVRAGADAAVPGLPIPDTVKRVDGGHVVETISRDALVAVQTPQAFRTDALRAAHRSSGEATDDAALVEAAGGQLGNVDVVVAAERPVLAPHVRSMTDNLCHALVPLFPEPGAQNLVSVKPKRGEGLGAIGRGEGVAVWAVALLESVGTR